ncbi:MAG TPA: L-fucokinase [Armatimonadota bacterium]|jgi:fucokinase
MSDLRETIWANRERYARQVRGEEPGDWDWCVLTAGSAAQARGYELELERRRAAGWIPPQNRLLVVADPEGHRLGSGGGAAYALREVARQWAAEGRERLPRVLVINSGGESRRLPACAAYGKAFLGMPFPLFPAGPRSTVFDELMVSVCGLPERLGAGVMILSGDVMIGFDPEAFSPGGGVTGLACRCPWELAARHGVYVAQGATVQRFLQKPSQEEMRQAGALAEGQALLDTGLFFFAEPAMIGLASLAGVKWHPEGAEFGPGVLDEPASGAQIDLYREIALTLAGEPPEGSGPLAEAVRRALGGVDFSVCVPSPCSFVHLGTTAEWLDFSTGQTQNSRLYAELTPVCEQQNRIPHLQTTPPALVEYSRLPAAELGAGAVLSGVESAQALTVPEGLVLGQVPLRGDGAQRWVSFLTPAEFSPNLLDKSTRIAIQSYTAWLETSGISAEDLWPEVPAERRSLWNARLYVSGDRETTTRWALWLAEPGRPEEVAEWRAQGRLSLAEVVALADPEALFYARRGLEAEGLGEELRRALAGDEAAESLGERVGDGPGVAALAEAVAQYLEEEPSRPRRARAYQALADILGAARLQPLLIGLDLEGQAALRGLVPGMTAATEASALLEDAAFAEVRRAVGEGLREPDRGAEFRLTPGAAVVVEIPARLDFGGGWSDTPPFSLEHGGTVLNAALQVGGVRPIVVRGEVLAEPILEIVSEDGGVREVITDAEQLRNYGGPGDSLALHRAALVMAGFTPDQNLRRLLQGAGGGLRLQTNIRLPQGSGLGTSSLAAVALLRCLDELQGRESSREELSARVLLLEQRLTTGGGWQDQLGGLAPGIKLLETEPGYAQTPTITPLQLSPATQAQLQARLVVCFVGERRVAKNILRQIMRRYLARAPEVVSVLHEIKVIAREMKAALEGDDLDAFGGLMARHWALNKQMDRLTTTPHVETLFAAIGDLASGAKLAGAGGGGFMEIIAKEEAAVDEIRRRLEPLLAAQGGRLYEVALDSQGLVARAE